MLARLVADARLKPERETAIARGNMAVVSCSTHAKLLTSTEALERNELAARLAAHRDSPCHHRRNLGQAISFVAQSWFAGAEACGTRCERRRASICLTGGYVVAPLKIAVSPAPTCTPP